MGPVPLRDLPALHFTVMTLIPRTSPKGGPFDSLFLKARNERSGNKTNYKEATGLSKTDTVISQRA